LAGTLSPGFDTQTPSANVESTVISGRPLQ
jgi:hypothetical protein